MEKNELKEADFGEEIFNWKVPEHEKHERPKSWYIGAGITALALLLFAFFTGNFLFAVIIIVFSLIVIWRDGQDPEMVRFSITDEGLSIGKKFIDYDEIKDFSIVYKPKLGVKNLYFEFKNPLRHRLSIPLLEMNPLIIRKSLLKYLKEDLERTDQPLSEYLGKLFKL